MDFLEHTFTCHVHGAGSHAELHEVRGKVARSTRTVQNFSPNPRATLSQALWKEHYIFAQNSRHQQYSVNGQCFLKSQRPALPLTGTALLAFC